VPELAARRVVAATLVVLAVACAFYLGYRFRWALFSLFVGIVLGTAVRPAVDWLERRGLERWTAGVVVYLCLLGVVVAAAALLLPMVVDQITTVAARLPGYYESLRSWLASSSTRTVRQLASGLPAHFGWSAPALMARTTAWAGVLGHAAFTVLSILLLGFYWTLEGHATVRALVQGAQPERRTRILELVLAAEGKVGAYVRGQTLVCLSVGLMQLTAYLIIGLPYALVLGLVAAILEAVPIVGPTLGALPAGLLALSIQPSLALWVALSTLIVQLTENYVLIPRVMDRSVGVSPVVTLLAIAAFSAMLGLPGALLAIPMAAILQLLFARLVLERAPEGPAGRLGELRYQARQLALDARALLRRDAQAHRTAEVGLTDEVVSTVEALATDVDRLLGDAETTPPPSGGTLAGRPT
jgi:predicted PurR-regulated permease PerM